MKDLLYLREKSLKEILELIFQAYIDSYSDPNEVLKKNSFGRAHHRLLCIIEGSPNITIADILRKLKITKQSLHMLPRMDDNGDPMFTKSTRSNGRQIKEERHKIEVFQEFYIEDKIAIKDLIHLFAVNAKTFDYEAFMTKTEIEDLPVAGV